MKLTYPLCYPGEGRGPVGKAKRTSRITPSQIVPNWAPAFAGVVQWRWCRLVQNEHPLRRTRGQAGFTLVEVMISLFIFGLLAAAGVGLLSFSVRAQTATAAKLDDIAAFNRLTSSLTADLAQALPRRARGEGGEIQPAFFGAAGSGTAPMLRLVRGGWSNLDEAPRASVQKVDYIYVDGGIARVAYPMIDGAAPLPTTPMLTHVRGATFRYRYNGAWSDHWDGGSVAVMPQAMELRLVRDNGTEFHALFLVGADQMNHATG